MSESHSKRTQWYTKGVGNTADSNMRDKHMTRKPRTLKPAVPVAVPFTVPASPEEFGQRISRIERSAAALKKPLRDWFVNTVLPTFAAVTMSKPNKDGVLVSWREVDIKSDDVKDYRKHVVSGMVTDLVESGEYPNAVKAIAVKNAGKEARKSLGEEIVKACDELVARIVNRADQFWSRNVAAWIREANEANRATATGTRKDAPDSFKALIGGKGALRKKALSAAKRDRDAGLPSLTEDEVNDAFDTMLSDLH